MSLHAIEKHAFSSLLAGMITKLIGKGGKAEKQLASLERMSRFLERLTYVNILFTFQSKLITEQERQILDMNNTIQHLQNENISLKKEISDEKI
jgi:hypothetical protein